MPTQYHTDEPIKKASYGLCNDIEEANHYICRDDLYNAAEQILNEYHRYCSSNNDMGEVCEFDPTLNHYKLEEMNSFITDITNFCNSNTGHELC